MKKRLFTALLAAAVCFTCLPAQTAFAEGEDILEDNAVVDTVPAEDSESEVESGETETPKDEETKSEIENLENEAENALLTQQDDEMLVQERQQYPPDEINGVDWYHALFGDLQADFNIDRSNGLDKGELYNYRGNKENVMLPYVYENVGTGMDRALISIVKIRAGSFTEENAKDVKRVTIPDSVKTIESGAFTNSGLTAVWVPESVTEIGENAFPAGITIYGYAKVVKTETTIGENEYGMEEYQINRIETDKETAIYKYAVDHSLNFVAVDPRLDIRNGTIVDIGSNFKEKELVLPEIVFQFASNFTHNYGQYTIKTITLPASFGGAERNDNIWSLGSIHLETIIVDEDNPHLTSVDGCLFSKDKTEFLYYPSNKSGSEYAIPEGTVRVDGLGLWSTRLKKITIPASVKDLSAIALDTLEEIIVEEGNTVYATEDGVLYGPCTEGGPGMENISGYGILLYPAQKSDKTSFTVPEEVNGKKVTIIGAKAFFRQEYLKEINLSDNIIGAGNQAFIYCKRLQEITIPQNMTEIDISSPFTGCSDLTSIDVAEENPRFKSIDGVMFSKDGTRLVAYPGGRKELFNTYFVPDGTKTIGMASFADNRSLQVVHIPEGVTTIESDAFGSCEALYAVHLPNSLVEIQPGAFMWSRALSIVQLPQNGSLKTIGREAFRECDRLLAIKVPSSITTIQNLGGNPTNRYIFPEHTLVIAAKDSIMWQPDPANKGVPYGGKHLVSPYEFLHGDLNNDKKISMTDMELLWEYLRDNNFGIDKGIDAKSADANGDGKVDEADWDYLKNAIAKGLQE